MMIPASVFPVEITDPATALPTNFEWITVDISDLNIAINPGDTMAFGLGIPAQQTIGSFTINVGSSTDTYAGGTSFIRIIDPDSFLYDFWPTWTEQSTDLDLGFRTRVSVIPLPPAVWLFGSALGLLGWMRRDVAYRFKKTNV